MSSLVKAAEAFDGINARLMKMQQGDDEHSEALLTVLDEAENKLGAIINGLRNAVVNATNARKAATQAVIEGDPPPQVERRDEKEAA